MSSTFDHRHHKIKAEVKIGKHHHFLNFPIKLKDVLKMFFIFVLIAKMLWHLFSSGSSRQLYGADSVAKYRVLLSCLFIGNPNLKRPTKMLIRVPKF